MDKTTKILFVVPDGVGIRNYLYSNLLDELKGNKIALLSPLPEKAFYQIKNEFEYFPLNLPKEGIVTRIARESATYARLCYNADKVSNSTILKNWNYSPKGKALKVLTKVAQFLGKRTFKNYKNILFLEKTARNNWPVKTIDFYKKQLEEIQPTSIFITHQRVAALMPICIAAKQLNIPVIAAIYSWDNLPKGRLAVLADTYVVWSDYMKEEMHTYYPEIEAKNVIVAGTPQFEFYLQKNKIISRETFASQYGLDVQKKWICYSGDDVKTSPYDPQYLEDLAQAVSQIEESLQPQIIFRRCPVDFSTRYDSVLEKYKDTIIPIDPLWNVPNKDENWGAFYAKREDVDMQVNLAFHCEFVVNLGSTMAHDFAMFNKPCFYINYDKVSDGKWSVQTVYNYQHFRSMNGLEPVEWFNTKEEIKNKVEYALQHPEEIAKDRKKWLQKIVKHPLDKASVHIAELLTK